MFERVARRRASEGARHAAPEGDALQRGVPASATGPANPARAHRLADISADASSHAGTAPIQRVVRVKGAPITAADVSATDPSLATLRAWIADGVDDASRRFKSLAEATKESKAAAKAAASGAKHTEKVGEKNTKLKEAIDAKLSAAEGFDTHIFEGEFKKSVPTGYHSEFGKSATHATYGARTVIDSDNPIGKVYQQSVWAFQSRVTKPLQSTFFPVEATKQQVFEAVAARLAGENMVPAGLGYGLEKLKLQGIGKDTIFPAGGADKEAEAVPES